MVQAYDAFSRGASDASEPMPPDQKSSQRSRSAVQMRNKLIEVERNIKILEGWNGLTVFEVVRKAFPDISPREVFRKVRVGDVRRNSEPCEALARLVCGDILAVQVLRPSSSTEPLLIRAHETVETLAGSLFVLWEDEDLIAISKDPGCASHPALKRSGDTLIERVHAYLHVTAASPFRPGLANRLDLDTSGIVLVAKTRPAQSRLGRHFQKGLVQKEYLALVGGWPEPAEAEVRIPLVRHADSRDRLRMAEGHSKHRTVLQEAVTRFRTVHRFTQPLRSALLAVNLLTGRTHQIRRHLSQIGHPVAGDCRYGDPDFNVDIAKIGELPRLFLHACRVAIDHPRTGKRLVLNSRLPADLNGCLRALGGAWIPDLMDL